jgi:hypothetical protein
VTHGFAGSDLKDPVIEDHEAMRPQRAATANPEKPGEHGWFPFPSPVPASRRLTGLAGKANADGLPAATVISTVAPATSPIAALAVCLLGSRPG